MEQCRPKDKKKNPHTIIDISSTTVDSNSLTTSPEPNNTIYGKDTVKVVKERGGRKKNRHTPPGSPSLAKVNSTSTPTKSHKDPETRIYIKEERNENHKTTIHSHAIVLENENFSNDSMINQTSISSSAIFTDPRVSVNLSESSLSFMNSPDDGPFDFVHMTSVDSGLDETISEEDRQKLVNNRLKGTLNSLGSEAQVWLRERCQLASEVAGLKSHLAASRISCEEAIRRAESLTSELITSKKSFELHITNLNKTITEKSYSIKQLTQSLNQAKDDHINLSLKLQQYDANTSEKAQVSHMLKEKITDLCLEINQLRSVQSKSIEIESELRQEIESLQKSKKWFSEQLNISKASQERLSQELLQMKDFLREGSLHNHKLSHENTCLQSQLICLRTSLVEAKRSMSKQLDAIKSEMVEREALFASIKKDKSTFEELLRQKIVLLKQSEITIENLNIKIVEYEKELTKIRTSHEEIQKAFNATQQERDALLKKLSEHDTSLKEFTVAIETSKRVEEEVNQKYAELLNKSNANDTQLSQLKEETANLSQIINAMTEEKRVLTEYTDQLKGQLAEMNQRLETYQVEINQNMTIIIQLESNVTQLGKENEILKASVDEKQALITGLETEKQELNTLLANVRAENETLRSQLQASIEEMEKIRTLLIAEHQKKIEEITSSNQAQCQDLANQLTNAINELTSLKSEMNILLVTKGKYDILLIDYEKLKNDYQTALNEHQNKTQILEQQKQNSQALLEKFERESADRFNQQKEEICSYSLKVSSLETEIQKLTGEIGSIQKLKEAALAESKANWEVLLAQLRGELEQSRRDHESVNQELIRLREESQKKEAAYRNQISEHIQALSNLESRLSIIPSLEAKQKQLLGDLELYKGKEHGLRQSYMTLRNHTEELEKQMAEKEEYIARITHDNDLKARELLVNQSYLNLSNNISEEITAKRVDINQEIITAEYQTSSYGTETSTTPVQQYQSSIVPGSPPDLYLLEEELKRVQLERDRTNEALGESNKKISEIIAKLAITENAYENQGKLLEDLQKSNESYIAIKSDLQSKYDESQLDKQTLHEKYLEVVRLLEIEQRKSGNLEKDMAQICEHHKKELHSLRQIIDTATNHLKNINHEFDATREEKIRSETFLSQMRGSLMAVIEKHRAMVQLDSNLTTETISMDVKDIELLLGDESLSKESYLFNKPLSTLSKMFDTINIEIGQLETELVDHSAIVHESVHHWKKMEKLIVTNFKEETQKAGKKCQ